VAGYVVRQFTCPKAVTVGDHISLVKQARFHNSPSSTGDCRFSTKVLEVSYIIGRELDFEQRLQ